MRKGASVTGFVDFVEYFRYLWDEEPFEWQRRLTERVRESHWPEIIDLPTAAGKTGCIDIAVYALAAQADLPLSKRTAPRRIWFVVDRRIVVDEAFERAQRIAQKLKSATRGPLKEVADRLRLLSGSKGQPLGVARLRGGVLCDDGWARVPSQPAVITSTVDQLGSRLLFRGYGRRLLTAPIYAGLAGNDSLIVLDEGQCSVPFLETLRAVSRFRSADWAEEAIVTPFAFVVISATPPREAAATDVFPGAASEELLVDRVLRRRLHTSKPAELVTVTTGRDAKIDPLLSELCRRAVQFVQDGHTRVAVMVNRVASAIQAEAELKAQLGCNADVVLLTGRIRPFDRDIMIQRWGRFLRARAPEHPERPIVVVATQSLEVGADFSFDALVTECASVDALQQRFGRLARLGADDPAPAVVAIRDRDVDPKVPDKIYGCALSNTWQWLNEKARCDSTGRRVVDFGSAAFRALLQSSDTDKLLAPAAKAPLLLPGHLDLLSQTASPPYLGPDVTQYLHGKPTAAEVFVVWRCDLPKDTATWTELVALVPPVSAEMLTVPLPHLRRWLSGADAVMEAALGTDIEGADLVDESAISQVQKGSNGTRLPCLVWRGRDRSEVVDQASRILPGDVVVVPASYRPGSLGQAAFVDAVGVDRLDIWEKARAEGGWPAAVRLTEATLEPWLECPAVKDLFAVVTEPTIDRDALDGAIDAVLESLGLSRDSHTLDHAASSDENPPSSPPSWWLELLRDARNGEMLEHPAGGAILMRRGVSQPRVTANRHVNYLEADEFADDDDLASAAAKEISLEDHAQQVCDRATEIAERCLTSESLTRLREAIALAAYWHDAGKLDPRFQLLLWQGNEVSAANAEQPIAKSTRIPISPERRKMIRKVCGLPDGFRHEMLSAIITERFAPLPDDRDLRELVLHLVASHHGHARPWAPLCDDPTPPSVAGELGHVSISLSSADRAVLPPAHHISFGTVERFWRLTRRYGWWGLAYLEAIVRLADWDASRETRNGAR